MLVAGLPQHTDSRGVCGDMQVLDTLCEPVATPLSFIKNAFLPPHAGQGQP